MKITAKTTSPKTMPLRTLSAASTTNAVSSANTAHHPDLGLSPESLDLHTLR